MPFSSAPQLLQIQQPLMEINAANNGDLTPYNMATHSAIWFQISNTDHVMIAGVDWYWAWRPSDVTGGREVARTVNAYSLWFLNKHLKGSTDPMPALANYPRILGFRQK